MTKRRRIARSEEIIAAVSASIQNEPNQSIPRRSQELGIAQTTLGYSRSKATWSFETPKLLHLGSGKA